MAALNKQQFEPIMKTIIEKSPVSSSQNVIIKDQKFDISLSTFQDTVELEEQERKEYSPEKFSEEQIVERQKFMQANLEAISSPNNNERIASMHVNLHCRKFVYLHQTLKNKQQNQFIKYYHFNEGMSFDKSDEVDLAKSACALANSSGGFIYIGVYETTKTKLRVPFGYLLTEQLRDEFEQSIDFALRHCERRPKYRVDFIPMKQDPFMLENYSKYIALDQSEKLLNQQNTQKSSFIEGACLVKMTVFPADKMTLSSYRKENDSLIPFKIFGVIEDRSCGQELLRLYRQRLESKKQPEAMCACSNLPQFDMPFPKQVSFKKQQQWNSREKEIRQALSIYENRVYPPQKRRQIFSLINSFEFSQHLKIKCTQPERHTYKVKILVDSENGPKSIAQKLGDFLEDFCLTMFWINVSYRGFPHNCRNLNETKVHGMREKEVTEPLFPVLLCTFNTKPNLIQLK